MNLLKLAGTGADWKPSFVRLLTGQQRAISEWIAVAGE